MDLTHKLRWIYGLSFGFILLTAVCLFLELFWIAALPIVLIIIGLAIFRLDWLMYLIIFSVPLSLNFEDLEFGLGLSVPTEPLMFGAMLVFIFKVMQDGHYDRKLFMHPITLSIIVYLLWIGITSITSEMPWVSFKVFIATTWFIVNFYFITSLMFKNKLNLTRFFWILIFPMAIVIVYTFVHHAMRGFAEKPAHWVMQPFFKDHTSYGALVAFFIPVLFGFIWLKGARFNTKILAVIFLLIFLVGVIFSYTRAAWVSLVAAIVVWAILKYRVKLSVIVAMAIVALGIAYQFQDDIFMKLEKNRQDSSGDFAEHVQSISNVATDASNLERLNRWNAAFRMYQERPVFGFGPGTYMFLYAPYQHSSEKTIISTNFGDGGNAHSEYFGPLAEAGTLGLLSFLMVIIVFFYYAVKLYYELQDAHLKRIVEVVILAQTTYFVHGFLNNFLDLDKANVVVWGCMAIVTVIDVYHKKESVKLNTE